MPSSPLEPVITDWGWRAIFFVGPENWIRRNACWVLSRTSHGRAAIFNRFFDSCPLLACVDAANDGSAIFLWQPVQIIAGYEFEIGFDHRRRDRVENRGQDPSAHRQLLFAPLFLLAVFGAH